MDHGPGSVTDRAPASPGYPVSLPAKSGGGMLGIPPTRLPPAGTAAGPAGPQPLLATPTGNLDRGIARAYAHGREMAYELCSNAVGVVRTAKPRRSVPEGGRSAQTRAADPYRLAGDAGNPAAEDRDPDGLRRTRLAQPRTAASSALATASARPPLRPPLLPALHEYAVSPVHARGPSCPAEGAVQESSLELAAYVQRVQGLFGKPTCVQGQIRSAACAISQASWKKGAMSRCPLAAGSAWTSHSSAANGTGGSGLSEPQGRARSDLNQTTPSGGVPEHS